MEWIGRFRLLILIYTLGMIFGVREFVISRDKTPFTWLSPEGVELMEMISRLNPDDPDVQYQKAMHALAAGNRAEFDARIEDLLASNIKHNEEMLLRHAEYLLAVGAPPDEVNVALNRWRHNFPFARDAVVFRLASGPTTAAQAVAFEEELADIPWVADRRLERYMDGGVARWQVSVLFRRGEVVDVRDIEQALRAALSR